MALAPQLLLLILDNLIGALVSQISLTLLPQLGLLVKDDLIAALVLGGDLALKTRRAHQVLSRHIVVAHGVADPVALLLVNGSLHASHHGARDGRLSSHQMIATLLSLDSGRDLLFHGVLHVKSAHELARLNIGHSSVFSLGRILLVSDGSTVRNVLVSATAEQGALVDVKSCCVGCLLVQR